MEVVLLVCDPIEHHNLLRFRNNWGGLVGIALEVVLFKLLLLLLKIGVLAIFVNPLEYRIALLFLFDRLLFLHLL